MKVKKLGLEWGPAFIEATPIQITHNDAEIVIFISESGDLCVNTVRSTWKLTSAAGGCDCRLVVSSS